VIEAMLEGVEPARVWERFLELTRIARPSKAEGAARAHVLEWARVRGLSARADAAGNVVVVVPATAGRDAAPTVVLQSHLDMVCERDPASPYDPREGRIDVHVEGDWVQARDTTLGADNGIGVAAALAVAEGPDLVHGPLELLFTVSEEQGLTGARMLDASLVSGRRLVNLDGTSDEGFTVGCAGSNHTFVKLPLAPGPAPADRVALRIGLSGARGGHSGEGIAKGRANAIKCLGRVLSAAFTAAAFELAALSGGVSRNAIPRDAHALVALPGDRVDAFRAAAATAMDTLVRCYAGTDDGLVLSIEGTEPGAVAGLDATRRALDLVAATPTGVVAMSTAFPGVVETSTSLTVASTDDGVLTLASMARSSSAPALDELLASAEALARLAGAEVDVRRSYPPWEPRLDSPLLETAKGTYRRLFDVEPVLTVVHGGLECAVLGQKLRGVEMVSIGPEVVGPHAPGEKLSISSTQRFYRLLGGLLDDLSR
jgi:dipeptidase D